MRYHGKLYRALNPIYAHEPLSGRGAQLYGGRFNSRGTAALYLSTSLLTAIREANQVGDLQPTAIVSYHADIEKIFDSRDLAALNTFSMTPTDLADHGWRNQMKANGKAGTQIFAENLVSAGFNGLLIRSFVRGATDDDLNIVLWTWSDMPPVMIAPIDDDGRLSKI